ncbi:MAG: serine/threonine protein kinase [Deltaproteobacteria bacterium]|nr:serine/threonine protein kinase [Deltaproteobacteria bacterium]
MALNLPQTFGKYVLLRKLAVGGMAEVFLAKALGAEGFQRTVVIKRILPSYSEDEAFVSMFIDEARIAAALHHASIVQIIDFDKVDDAYYIAMEYIEGYDLRKVLNQGAKADMAMTPLMTAHAIAQIASGLHYAHSHCNDDGEPLNIIHRDVSPHNILLSFGGDVKLTDFGIAKAAARSTKTRAGTVKGKCAYMSPEQAKGKPLDPRSDIFALCAVTWEMLTYKRLFEGDSDFEILNNVLNQSVPPASLFRKSVPRELDAIILKGLRKAPDERYSSMAALEKDLENFVFKHASGREELDLAAYMQSLFEKEGQDYASGSGRTPTPKKTADDAVDKDAEPGPDAGTELLSHDMESPRRASQAKPEAETMAIDVSDDDGPPTTVPVGMLRDEVEEIISAAEKQTPARDRENAAPTLALPEAELKATITDTGEGLESRDNDLAGSTGNLPVGVESGTGVRARRSSKAAMWVFFLLVGVALGIGGYYGTMILGERAMPDVPDASDVGGIAGIDADAGVAAIAVVIPDPGPKTPPDAGPMAVAAARVDAEVVEEDGVSSDVPVMARVRLLVKPRGARVRVNGELVPLKNGVREIAGSVKVGDRLKIKASAAGYRTHRSVFKVEKSDDVVNIALSKRTPAKRRPRPEPAETGFVTINARPWADVYYKGRKIGTTPVRRFKVGVGRQVFTLRNKVASKSVTIVVDKDHTTTRVVDM